MGDGRGPTRTGDPLGVNEVLWPTELRAPGWAQQASANIGAPAGISPLNTVDTAHSEGTSAFAQAAELELRDVSKRYAGQREPAIKDLSLTVPAGEVCVLVGPSGSGKTTAMRLINRLIPLTGGDILLGGRSVLERAEVELRRQIGYVIQQTGLFPHQTVQENIATVPKLLGWHKDKIAPRVHELLELVA